MASRTCRRDMSKAQAQETAQAIIAQSRQVTRSVLKHQGIFPAEGGVMEQEPMNRYIHPITPAEFCPPPSGGDVKDYLGRILEHMACQNQLLVDILGSINSLTAATLIAQSRQ